jgi:hypothetical protein
MCIHPTAKTRSGRGLGSSSPQSKIQNLKSKIQSGFTLIEVIAAMALMMFVVGGVYGIANGAMELGKSMSDNRIHETRITNFVSSWRDYLENLPPGAKLTVGEKPSRKFGRGSLLIENGTVPYAWNPAVRLSPAVEFKLERSENVRNALDLHVVHLHRNERPTANDDYKVVADLPLLEGLREFKWEFYDAQEEKWVTLWEDQPTPPLFLRLKFGFITESRSYEYTFWISGGNHINETPGGAPPPQGSFPNGPPPAQGGGR